LLIYRFSHKDFGLRSQIKIRPQRTIVRLRIILIWRLAKIFITKSVLLSATQSDLIYKVERKDVKKLLIYFLIEHKSYYDRWVLFQVLGYIVRINEREHEINKIERKKKREKNKENNIPINTGIAKEYITPVIPIIFYHGEKKWNYKDNIKKLYSSLDICNKYLPDFEYELLDLSDLHDDEIKGIIFLKAAILAMKHYYNKDFDLIFQQILLLFFDIIDQKSTLEFIAIISLYSSSNKNRGGKWLKSNLKKNFRKVFGNKCGVIMDSVGNIWIEQGKKEMLLETLKTKFNFISQSIASTIQSIQDDKTLHTINREAILCNDIKEFQLKLKKIVLL